ncbi:MAG: dual specificity protein phosphatase family protein [Anaerolineae bacterium]|nr:dual specificity protein phosphatase family protein [Anaerolineae bacterium]
MDAIRPWLYIGKYRDTLDYRQLGVYRIGAVLQLAEPVHYARMDALYLVIEDGEPLPFHLLRQGIDFALAAKARGKNVLIACGAGVSRSATFAAAALKEAESLSLLDAIRSVYQHHPETLPHPELWKSLSAYYQEDVSVHDMLAALHPSE